MAARVASVMRATSLAGLALTLVAQKVDDETILSITGDGCRQILYHDLMVQLEGWARAGVIAPGAVAGLAFAVPYLSLWHVPALAVWTVVSNKFLFAFSMHQLGIYGCDIFAVPSDLAFVVMFARPVLCLAPAVLAVLLPKKVNHTPP